MFDFLAQKFSGVLGWLKDKGRLTEDNIAQALQQVREALLEADVPLQLVEDFLAQVSKEVVGQKVLKALNPGQQFIKVVHQKLLTFLGHGQGPTQLSLPIPSIMLVMGLQGSGKTTTLAKIAHWLVQQAKARNKTRRILVASVDFYRPAAIDQLEILAKQAGVAFYRASSSDPLTAAQEINAYFKQGKFEHLLLDTAGRLHVDQAMMQELISINSALAPKYKLLVLDAMTGQQSLAVAQEFETAVGFDSVVLSKIDSDARGGAAFAFRYALHKPILFVGIGEKLGELESFVPERMASRILGMGDLLTLIEKASETIDEKASTSMANRMMSGNFNLHDFMEQLAMIEKMGSLQKIARYLPTGPGVSAEQLHKGQAEINRFRAILSSMTPKERLIPALIDQSRKTRIAKGSGTQINDVNQLLEKFEQSRQFVKMLKKSGKLGRFF